MSDCPCGSGQALDACCGPYLAGTRAAPTPEALMRSRFSAFATANVDYLYDTIAPDQRDDFDRAATLDWASKSKWGNLVVHGAEGGADDAKGVVEFTAFYRMEGKDHGHHETARFRKEDGRWFYVDGVVGPRPVEQRVAPKVGRNDPCPCGSGKKFKKCCGA